VVRRDGLAGGGLVGLGALTRYSFGWLIVPVLCVIGLYFAQRRVVCAWSRCWRLWRYCAWPAP